MHQHVGKQQLSFVGQLHRKVSLFIGVIVPLRIIDSNRDFWAKNSVEFINVQLQIFWAFSVDSFKENCALDNFATQTSAKKYLIFPRALSPHFYCENMFFVARI